MQYEACKANFLSFSDDIGELTVKNSEVFSNLRFIFERAKTGAENNRDSILNMEFENFALVLADMDVYTQTILTAIQNQIDDLTYSFIDGRDTSIVECTK